MSDSERYLRTIPLNAREPFGGVGTRVTALAHHRDGVEVIPLLAGQPLCLGRVAPPADVAIADPSLSLQHARLSLDDEGQVTIEDLDSTNGTTVRGAAINAPTVLPPGESAQLGAVVLTLHVLAPAAPQPRQLEGHERFGDRLSDELTRHRALSHELAVLLLRQTDEHRALPQWSQNVCRTFGPLDFGGVYSRRSVELTLPHTSADEAARRAREVLAAEPSLACGLALYPTDAGNADELLSQAVDAAASAQAGEVAGVAATGPHAPRHTEETLGPAMKKVYTAIDRLAKATIPVLLLGETGVGKEVIAGEIHRRGPRARGPLRTINCGAIPAELIESTLFGHERGAFTGAQQQRKGIFEVADGGTVLLDEVGELSQAAQVALLRVLETKTITRVGAPEPTSVDVRVLAATHRDLESMCEAGAFRWDLLYRLNTMTLAIPPLRERGAEIAALTERFIADANAANGCDVRGISAEALAVFESHHWRGNVRELKNVVARCVVMAEGDVIDLGDLPERMLAAAGALSSDTASSNATKTPNPAAIAASTSSGADATADEAAARTAADLLDDNAELPFRERIRRFEVELIREALRRCGGRRVGAARLLQMPTRTLSYKLRSYELDSVGGEEEDA